VTPAATVAKPTPAAARRRPLPTALVTLVLGFVVGLGILFAWRRNHASDGESAGGNRRLAVLPFENLGDSSDEYFADGMTDEIRGKLAKLQGLQVIASGSTGQYKHSDKTPTQIAQELGVQYLLTGKIRWEKGEGGKSRVRVSPELVQVGSGGAPTTKWQEPFDASLTDVFQVQADIAGRVASALDVALGSTERETIAKRPTENLAAYDAFLKGEEISASMGVADPATLRQAVVQYERAVAFDTTFVQAWAQLSRARSRIYTNGAADPALGAGARAAAERALALAPDRADGRLALGAYYSEVLSDNDKAMEQFERGRKIDPRNADLLAGIAVAEQARGHYDLVVRDLTEAQAMDPRSTQTVRRLARALLWLRRYPEALAAANRGLELSPGNIDMIEGKAMVYFAQGDSARGREVLSRTPAQLDEAVYLAGVATYWDLYWALTDDQQRLLLRLTPEPFDNNRAPWALALAGAYELHGDAAKSRAYADSARISFEEQLKLSPDDSQLHALYGVALAYLGHRDEAVREANRSLDLLPPDKDAFSGPYNQHQVARIYMLTGQQEKAIDLLEELLEKPYFLSPGWLTVDPNFDPLRRNPRFQKLVAGAS
jgi:TolB-like protein